MMIGPNTEGKAMAKQEQKKRCECDNCVAERFYYCQSVEQQLEAKRKGFPPIPAQNAPSTMRLQ